LQDDEEVMKPPDQFAWQILTQTHVSKFKTLSINELMDEMGLVLSLTKAKEDLHQAAILDFFVTAFVFAKESDFTDEQSSAFFTIIHKLIDNIRGNNAHMYACNDTTMMICAEKNLSLGDNVQQLQSYLMGIEGSSPHQCSLNCFTINVAQKCIEYIHTSLFQHYSLFEYIIHEKQEDEPILVQLQACVPPNVETLCPAPLEEAVPEDFYNRLIKPPCSSPIVPSISSLTIEETQGNDTPVINSLNVTSKDIQMFIEGMAADAVTSFQEEFAIKLKERESNYASKLAKMEKVNNKKQS
jgi:hypothetical protein